MRITQGQFSFLPDLSDEQITKQIKYAIDNGWAVNVEYTDDPHPRNTYWEMWGSAHVRPEGPGGHHDGGQRLPRGAPAPLHPGVGIRRHARRGVFADVLHRQSAGRGTRFPRRTHRYSGPEYAIYPACLRHGKAGKASDTSELRAPPIASGSDTSAPPACSVGHGSFVVRHEDSGAHG